MIKPWLRLPLRTKFFLALFSAVLLPALLLVTLGYFGVVSVNRNNVFAYLNESMARRSSALTQTVERGLDQVRLFITDEINREAILRPLTEFNPSRQSEDDFIFFTIANLLSNTDRLFDSAWLLSRQGVVVAAVTLPDQALPFTRGLQQETGSTIFRAARLQTLQSFSGNEYVTVLADRGGVLNFEAAFSIFDARGVLRGYFVVDFNTEAALLNPLRPEAGDLQSYSFLVPQEQPDVALAPIEAQGRIDLSSEGVARGINREASTISEYPVQTSDGDFIAFGTHRDVALGDTEFALITEMDASIIGQQVFDFVSRTGFPLLLGLLSFGTLLALLLNQAITPPVVELRDAVRAAAAGRYDAPINNPDRGDELGELAQSVIDMRTQVRQVVQDISARLETRDRDIRLTQDINRAATAERSLQGLMDKAVNLITQNFPSIYHAQIFLIDSENTYAVLRASTGEAGRELLARGHRLAVGSVSVIGQVTEQGTIIVARDTNTSNVHRQNEFLSATRAELAIPLRLGTSIIGALDVQSKQRDSFTPDLVATLQTLAEQLSVTIENARLYEQTQRLLSEVRDERSQQSQRAWEAYIAQAGKALVRSAGNPTDTDFSVLRRAALHAQHAIVGERTARQTIPIAVPIRLREETLGVVEYELPAADFNYNRVLLAEELVNRLAISLDNARLFRESQSAADRERLVNEIAAKLTGQTDLDEILQIAIREIGQALRTPQVAIRFQGNANGNGSTHDDNGN